MLVFINKKRIVFTVMMAAESTSESFSESEENESSEGSEVSEEPVTPVGRKRRRSARLENYMRGKSRKAYRVNEDLTKSVSGSPHLEGVCPLCTLRSCQRLSLPTTSKDRAKEAGKKTTTS